jgi:hypothetical protein
MADTIIEGSSFNVSNIKYSSPKANSSGGKSINILNKATNTGLRISTPLMLTWGASDFEGNSKYDLSLQFPSDDYKNEEVDSFLKNMIEFENKIKSDALLYSKEWFGKQHKSPDVVEALWTPMLKYSKNKNTGEYDISKPPSLRVKIPFWENVWKCEIYDEDGNKTFPNIDNPTITPVDLLQKGMNIATLLQCGGLWFANGKFGITWKLIQAVGQKPRASLSGQCFIKLKSVDKEKLKKAAPLVDETQSDTYLEDSDNEDSYVQKTYSRDIAPVQTPVPAPAPVPVQEPVELTTSEQVLTNDDVPAQETPVKVDQSSTGEKTVVKKKIIKKKVVE